MTKDEIQKEWDSFIEYPNGSSKLYVTTTSALLFARYIADMAADKEREACAKLMDDMEHGNVRTCAAAMGQDVQEQSKELIKRMADTWADRNLDEVLA